MAAICFVIFTSVPIASASLSLQPVSNAASIWCFNVWLLVALIAGHVWELPWPQIHTSRGKIRGRPKTDYWWAVDSRKSRKAFTAVFSLFMKVMQRSVDAYTMWCSITVCVFTSCDQVTDNSICMKYWLKPTRTELEPFTNYRKLRPLYVVPTYQQIEAGRECLCMWG